jgi:hypothetical protein
MDAHGSADHQVTKPKSIGDADRISDSSAIRDGSVAFFSAELVERLLATPSCRARRNTRVLAFSLSRYNPRSECFPDEDPHVSRPLDGIAMYSASHLGS